MSVILMVLDVDRHVHMRRADFGFLERSDLVMMAKSESDVVPAIQKAFAAEWVDIESIGQAGIVGDDLVCEIDRKAVAVLGLDAAKKLVHRAVFQSDGKDAILETVVIEDVGIAWREDGSEAVVENGPRCVLTARAAAKVGAREKDACASIARVVQDKFGIGFLAILVAPIVEKNAAVALACLKLQELLGHHLVGVNIYAVHRCDKPRVFDKGFHGFCNLLETVRAYSTP